MRQLRGQTEINLLGVAFTTTAKCGRQAQVKNGKANENVGNEVDSRACVDH